MIIPNKDKQRLLKFLEDSEILSAEDKEKFARILIENEDLSEDFLGILGIWIEAENHYGAAQEKFLQTKLKIQEKKVAEADVKFQTDAQKILEDLKVDLEKTVTKAIEKMDHVEKKAIQGQEKLVHTEIEGSQIDALHDLLKKPKRKKKSS